MYNTLRSFPELIVIGFNVFLKLKINFVQEKHFCNLKITKSLIILEVCARIYCFPDVQNDNGGGFFVERDGTYHLAAIAVYNMRDRVTGTNFDEKQQK